MAAWRMALRGRIAPDGSWMETPVENWDECRELGIAAITYRPVEEVDFSDFSDPNDAPGWSELKPAQKSSMKCFIYEMQIGDAIYV